MLQSRLTRLVNYSHSLVSICQLLLSLDRSTSLWDSTIFHFASEIATPPEVRLRLRYPHCTRRPTLDQHTTLCQRAVTCSMLIIKRRKLLLKSTNSYTLTVSERSAMTRTGGDLGYNPEASTSTTGGDFWR